MCFLIKHYNVKIRFSFIYLLQKKQKELYIPHIEKL